MNTQELYQLNIERAILSAIMFDPSVLEQVSSRMDADMFYLPFHQSLFDAMLELGAEEKPIDEEFLRAKLWKNKKFDEVQMNDVLSTNPISSIDAYLQTIIELAKRRYLVAMSTEIKKAILEDGEDSSDVLALIDNKLDNASERYLRGSHKTASVYTAEVLSAMQQAQEAGGVVGYRSGIGTLDTKIGAFQAGDLIIIAARPSMGKTSLMTTIADYALGLGHGVYINSLEMSGHKIMARLISTRSKVPLRHIKEGAINNLESFNSAVEFYKHTSKLFIDEDSYIPIHDIKAKAIVLFRKHPEIKYWFLDHLRYIKKPGVNIANEVSEITKELKRVAKQYGVVVFLLSQLNRANEQRTSKRPMLSDLRESGAIEEDADMVIFPHRDSYYQRNQDSVEDPVSEAELLIGKNRDGEAGPCKCYFYGETTSFRNSSSVLYEYEYPNSGSTRAIEIPQL